MPNILSDAVRYDADDPDGYRAGVAMVGREAGGSAQNVKVYEIPPGQSLCPYHYEFEEEWLVVISGELALRTPGPQRTIVAGEIVCFPAGPEGAHKVTNRAQETARVLMFSSAREPAVCVYPDSDKIGVYTPVPGDEFMLRRENGHEPYYAGEM
jgi:uncharacterized cupin superfamily protein